MREVRGEAPSKSGTAAPNVELDYDSDPTGRTTSNAVGRLSRVWNGQVELSFNRYDPTGRAQVLDTSVGGATYHSNLNFDLIGPGMIGPEGDAGDIIRVTEEGLAHVLERHTINGMLAAGKSTFNAGEDVRA